MGLIFDSIYRKLIVKRYDDNHYVHYFSYKDFPGLVAEPFRFLTKQGNSLKGYFYSYPGYKKDHLIIFCHGLWGGHRSYLREIENLCKKGFQVASYDNTGCFESEGKDIRGFSESLNDLDSCLRYFKENHLFEGRKISVVGHSWGGYAAGNILNYVNDLHSVCVISGFASIQSIAKPYFKLFSRAFYRFEKKANPEFVDSSSLQAFKDSKANILIIHSKDDSTVPLSCGLALVQQEVNNPHVQYLLVDGKFHNPNYTYDAVGYMRESFGKFNRLVNQKKIKTLEEKQAYMNQLDFLRMTEQDEEVLSKIVENILK